MYIADKYKTQVSTMRHMSLREDDLYQLVFSLSLTDIVIDGNVSVYNGLGNFGM